MSDGRFTLWYPLSEKSCVTLHFNAIEPQDETYFKDLVLIGVDIFAAGGDTNCGEWNVEGFYNSNYQNLTSMKDLEKYFGEADYCRDDNEKFAAATYAYEKTGTAIDSIYGTEIIPDKYEPSCDFYRSETSIYVKLYVYSETYRDAYDHSSRGADEIKAAYEYEMNH